MNLKIRAIIGTVKVVLVGAIIYMIGHRVFQLFSLEEISVGISCISTAFLLYLIYDLKLSQLKHEDTLAELTTKYNEK
jgi:dipeptide/tripeptide permease